MTGLFPGPGSFIVVWLLPGSGFRGGEGEGRQEHISTGCRPSRGNGAERFAEKELKERSS